MQKLKLTRLKGKLYQFKKIRVGKENWCEIILFENNNRFIPKLKQTKEEIGKKKN